MKKSMKVKLAVLLAAAMVLGVASVGVGESSEVSGVQSNGGITPEVWSDVQEAQIDGYFSVKCEPKTVGTYTYQCPSDNGSIGTVVVEIYKTTDGPYSGITFVNWSSTIAVSYVWVKGGPHGGSLYKYDTSSYSDSGLYTPINVNNNKPSDVSHVIFYYLSECVQPEPEHSSVKVTKLDDDTEEPLGGWVFTLFLKSLSNGGDVLWSKIYQETTGEDGSVVWEELDPGDYKVEETLQDEWVSVCPSNCSYEFTLEALEVKELQFRNKRVPEVIYGTISGMKFYDEDDNGEKDDEEAGLPDWKIQLYSDSPAGAPMLSQVSGKELVDEVTTDEDGEFEFSGLDLGRYYLKEDMTTEQAVYWHQTTPEDNWFVVELTPQAHNVADVLFGNTDKLTAEEPPQEEPPDEELPDEEVPEEIVEEEVPLSKPPSDEVLPEVLPGEVIPEEEVVVEEETTEDVGDQIIAEAEIPLTVLPTTGGISPEILYGLGALVAGIGGIIRKRGKE